MEEYIREAPRVVSISREPLEYPERLLLTYKVEAVPATVDEEETPIAEPESEPGPLPSTIEVASPATPVKINGSDTGDLLGLNETNSYASAIEDTNALALAIVPADATTNSGTVQDQVFDPTGWELALVTTPSSNNATAVESKLGGGFDKLTLDSLYDEAAYRQQQQQQQQLYGVPPPNPFMTTDPFAMSNQVAAPPAVQMAAMAQQQQQMSMFMQSNPFAQPLYQQQPVSAATASNPFGDAGFGTFPVSNPHQESNPFGNPQLI